MAKFQFVKDTTSQTVLIFIQDSSSTVGAGLTGLTSGSASLTAYYYREGAGTGATAITLAATGSLGTWESGGFFEGDAAGMPGWDELGVPHAALATGADFVGIQLKGATNMAPCNLEIQLTGIDVNDATDGGIASVADWTNGGRLALILDIIAADVANLDGAAMRGTDNALLAASAPANFSSLGITGGGAISNVVLVATLTTYTANTPQTGDSFARLGAPAGASVSVDLAAVKAETAAILDDTGTAGVVVASGSKTGFKLAADGLALVIPADPSAIPVLGTTDIVGWIAYFGAWTLNEVNSDADSVNLRNSADSADLAAHATSDDGITFSSGAAT